MKQSIVMTVLGDDSPGLVKELSKLIVEHKGEWVERNMAHLVGQFAGILRINLPSDKVEGFCKAISKSKFGLQVSYSRVTLKKVPVKTSGYLLELIGQDQVGIINKLSSAFSHIQVNVEQLDTEIIDASMSGEHLFKAKALLAVPAKISEDELQDRLDEIADELILDIELKRI